MKSVQNSSLGDAVMGQSQEATLLNPLLQRSTGQQEPSEFQVVQLHAQLVEQHEGGLFTAKAGDGQELFPVKKAFSCLHHPLLGDKVLVSGCLRDGFYILAIIERPEMSAGSEAGRAEQAVAPAEIVIDLGEHVRLQAGHLAIEVNEGKVQSQHWTHQSQVYQLSAQAYRVGAHDYQVDSTTVTYRGQTMQYYAAQLDENYGQAERYVAGSDKVHALNFEYKAEQMARIHGNNTFINGEKLLKSDGQLMMVG